MTAGGEDDTGEQFDDEFRFLRWVRDPEGRLFCVEGVRTSGVSGPVWLAGPGGPLVQRLLSLVNKGLLRVQPPSRSHVGFDLEVSSVAGRRERVVLERSFDRVSEGRRRARALVSQIEDGTFSP